MAPRCFLLSGAQASPRPWCAQPCPPQPLGAREHLFVCLGDRGCSSTPWAQVCLLWKQDGGVSSYLVHLSPLGHRVLWGWG